MKRIVEIETLEDNETTAKRSRVRFYHQGGDPSAPMVDTATLRWSKAEGGKRLEVMTEVKDDQCNNIDANLIASHAGLGSVTLPDNPTAREVEDTIIERICVAAFGQKKDRVRLAIEHRRLADQGQARGGYCAQLAAGQRDNIMASKNATLMMALLGDRKAIGYQNDADREACSKSADHTLVM